MSNQGDFKFGDKTEIGMGSDVSPSLPSDAGLGFWAAQEGTSDLGGGQQQQQAQIPQATTVTVVTAKPVVKKADGNGLTPDRHGGEFNVDSHEPVGGFGGRLDLDM